MKKRQSYLAMWLTVMFLSVVCCAGVEEVGTSETQVAKSAAEDGTIPIRLSSGVRLVYKGKELQALLSNPGRAYVEAYILFPESLAEDIMMGLDELFEGKENPQTFEGADWMGLVTITRTGRLAFTVGAAKGHPRGTR